jgi:uncharacterized protein
MARRMEPPVSFASQGFWEATKKRELVLQWCKDCDKAIHYPREACPHCLGTNLEWRPSSGRGEVHAFSVMHRPANPMMADRVPYTVAIVELEGGARMMTNIEGCPPEDVKVGMPVKVIWDELSDGRHLPIFGPAD